jgi:hypothetical protein
MKSFAIIKDNKIVNIIVYDGIKPYNLGEGYELVELEKLKEQDKFVYREENTPLPVKITPEKIQELKIAKIEQVEEPIFYDCKYGEKLTLKQLESEVKPIEEKGEDILINEPLGE